MLHYNQKKIAVINDFCVFGRCSITVSIPIISAMKIQCCPLPTAIFSNHTGYNSFFYTDYTQNMNSYINEWIKLDLHFNGILTGFLGNIEQIDIVKNFIKIFKTNETLFIMDPIMGDDGELYPTYSPKFAEQMISLVPYADILTPNLTEACILTKTKYKANMTKIELSDICNKLSEIGPKKIVITGLNCGNFIENFVYDNGNIHIIKEPKIGTYRAGTGDVFSSIIAADIVNGKDFIDAVSHAASFINKVLNRTIELNIPKTDGICFEEYLTEI